MKMSVSSRFTEWGGGYYLWYWPLLDHLSHCTFTNSYGYDSLLCSQNILLLHQSRICVEGQLIIMNNK